VIWPGACEERIERVIVERRIDEILDRVSHRSVCIHLTPQLSCERVK
jgi:hypothetical protein